MQLVQFLGLNVVDLTFPGYPFYFHSLIFVLLVFSPFDIHVSREHTILFYCQIMPFYLRDNFTCLMRMCMLGLGGGRL